MEQGTRNCVVCGTDFVPHDRRQIYCGRRCNAKSQNRKQSQRLGRKARGTIDDRFFSKVHMTDSCWLWTGPMSGAGYGRITIGGRQGSQLQAHRVAYEQIVGPIPSGLDLDHLCRVRNCVRPEHLEPVTRQENLRRGAGFIGYQMGQTRCIHGHAFDEANTYWRYGRQRQCRACHARQERTRRERIRA